MAPWKKGVPRSFGNLIKHRIARLLGQFTGVALDRIIKGGPLPDKGQLDRFTALYHTLRNRGQPFDTRIHLESSTIDFIRALTLLSKRVCSLTSELLLLPELFEEGWRERLELKRNGELEIFFYFMDIRVWRRCFSRNWEYRDTILLNRVIIASGIVRGGVERTARAKKEWRVRNLFLFYEYSWRECYFCADFLGIENIEIQFY